MTNKNYQICKFYTGLFELKEAINNEIIPCGVNIGINEEDAKLMESLEVLAVDINEHLKRFELQIFERYPKQI